MSFLEVSIDEVTPLFQRLALALSPSRQSRLMLQWGAYTANEARKNALAKGGRRLWRAIARSVMVEKVGARGDVAVRAYHIAAAQKQFGGSISAPGKGPGSKGAEALTIPIADEAEGRMASEFDPLGIFRPKGTNVLAINRGGVLENLFALVKSTEEQKADPWWPTEDDTLRYGTRLATMLLERGGA